MPILRPYQAKLGGEVRQEWMQGAQTVLMRLDTGGGKTVILSDICLDYGVVAAVIAHRQELLGQLSLALALNGVYHDIIAPTKVIRAIVNLHLKKLGKSFFRPGAPTRVVGIDTLVNRFDELRSWAAGVTRVIVDEGHHVVHGNKWDRGLTLFTNPMCKILLPTATPRRADGKGLGRHADGVADVMVQGPPMRWLIEEGYLTDYRMFCVESDMQLLEADIGESGDWSTAKLRAAARASHIVGDVVRRYLEFAPGKLGVTFCPDVETAGEIQARYIANGVPAGLLTGKTDDGIRLRTLERYEAREILQLVVVDIVSEGFDMPAIEVASMARQTASLATFMQQFGRTLRPMPGKDRAMIIDHVGNYLRHGPPDRPRDWNLNRAEKRSSASTGIPLRMCLGVGCHQPYPRTKKVCPYCDEPAPPPEGRGSPKQVEGDMAELDPMVLAALRGEIARVDMDNETFREQLAARHVPTIGQLQQVKIHDARRQAQATLREAMALWCGVRHAAGATDSEIQREFWHVFSVDVLSAQTLDAADADALRGRL